MTARTKPSISTIGVKAPKNGTTGATMSQKGLVPNANRFKTISTSSSPFTSWPVPMIESQGDYRAESFIEDLVGGPLYEKQNQLPKLPIPDIQDTIHTLLPTALPLAETKEEAEKFIAACQSFPSQAKNLHFRLIQRKDIEMKDSSYLQLWWNTGGYLQVRDPVVVNVSYFFHFSDDVTLPNDKPMNVTRGASLLYSAAEFRKRICTGTYPQEQIGKAKTPLCSVAFKYMFNACRIPHRGMDGYRIYDPSVHKHCIVARKGVYFSFDFVDDEGNPLDIEHLETNLMECIRLADLAKDVPKLGFLTSSDRDSWADARDEMIKQGHVMVEKALERLESGALLLCLDEESPISRTECANVFWTGHHSSGHNRWFDKSIQLMVTENGKAGLIGEHSMMDGMPMIAFANSITQSPYIDKVRTVSRNHKANVQNIFSSCQASLMSGTSLLPTLIERSKLDFAKLISDHDLDVLSFQRYGSNQIKAMGYSPDAYAQMAIQLAMYRLVGKQCATYEATQMRSYKHGRTETTRAVSLESAAFVKHFGMKAKFNDDIISMHEKKEKLTNAVQAHVKYIGKAAKGKGVDRHLLGMSMLTDATEKVPDLYNDPLYIRSKTWRVSTSHLTHPRFENWGFGEVVPDGVGVAYGIKNESIIFNITARKCSHFTERMCHLLEEALLEMQLVHEVGNQYSKL